MSGSLVFLDDSEHNSLERATLGKESIGQFSVADNLHRFGMRMYEQNILAGPDTTAAGFISTLMPCLDGLK